MGTAVKKISRKNDCIDRPTQLVDSNDHVCTDYAIQSTRCGKADTSQFNSSDLCCACGGGITHPSRRDTFNTAWSCTPCQANLSFASKEGSATCSRCHTCQDTEVVAQACTLTSNTVCACKPHYVGTPSTPTGVHTISPCIPYRCTRPSEHSLYDLTRVEETLVRANFHVDGLTCVRGSYGTPIATGCQGTGEYTLDGCSACQNGGPGNGHGSYTCPNGHFKTGTRCGGGVEDTQTCERCATNSTDGMYQCSHGQHVTGSRCSGESGMDTQTCTVCNNTNPVNGNYACPKGDFQTGLACNGTFGDTQTCSTCNPCDTDGQYTDVECTSTSDSVCACVRGFRMDTQPPWTMTEGGAVPSRKRTRCVQNKTYVELAVGFLVLLVLYDFVFMAGTSSAGAAPHAKE